MSTSNDFIRQHEQGARNYKFDNLKLLLIFLVVFGHLIEIFYQGEVYQMIYTFYMPAFIFITGFFAKFDFKRWMKKLVIPYVLLQIVSVAVKMIINNKFMLIEFLKPQWVLWYVFAMIVYTCLVPLLKNNSIPTKIMVVVLSVVISLLSGYLNYDGKLFSLARILTFLPFFIVGFYINNKSVKDLSNKIWSSKKGKWASIVVAGMVLVGCFVGAYFCNFPVTQLYGSVSYMQGGFNIIGRALQLLLATGITFSLVILMPSRKFIVSYIGRYTWPIYIIHAYLTMGLGLIPSLFTQPLWANFCIAIVFAIFMVFVLGNKYMAKGLNVLTFNIEKKNKPIKRDD